MRRPPPLSQLRRYPVIGATAVVALALTAAWHFKTDVSALQMNYLAWHGQPWRLLTSAFLHVDPLHLLFNLYWLWVFGTVLESAFGSLRTMALIVVLASGSAAAEYAFANGGVGLSGVTYGFFGLLWVL